jgi:predicted nucleic acid-binding protein
VSAPTRLVVIDASAMVALLADAGPAGTWVASTIAGAVLCAPELMAFETANILRRHAAAGLLDATAATLAHADLVAMPIDYFGYEVLAVRAWALRTNLSTYDASYVALAEMMNASLVTLDARISRAPGVHCQVLVP